ncbi:MAG: DUF2309 domain-containing protein [Burkholderiales bacterium]|nr:DUF2309 domain-containing protein [Nitrosomonas sp.]MCP5275633.1 DUF2309 domain-containing protein [Burkholderiales bacterium]
MQEHHSEFTDIKSQILHYLDHLGHILPGQATIREFVHHNTIHGFQHLPFEEAVKEVEALTGVHGYLSDDRNRDLYRRGYINDDDLAAALAHETDLEATKVVCRTPQLTIKRNHIYRAALLADLQGVSASNLNWMIEELDVLCKVQSDVPDSVRSELLEFAKSEEDAIYPIWKHIIDQMELDESLPHPENMIDLSEDQARIWLEKIRAAQSGGSGLMVHQKMRIEAEEKLNEMLDQVGVRITMREFVKALTGIDILFSVRIQLIRILGSALDEGISAWRLPDCAELGLYTAWRKASNYDANPFLHDLPDWQRVISEAPEDPIDCIVMQLNYMEIPEDKWEGYLKLVALELPGWSGMINWRQSNPNYISDAGPTQVHLADYLAIRLVLDRLWLSQACEESWRIDAKLDTFKYYFNKNLSEFMVRETLFQGNLPEYLTQLVNDLLLRSGSERYDRSEWQELADLIWTWQFSPMAENRIVHNTFNSGWRLFRLCQHLGINIAKLRDFQKKDFLEILNVLNDFTPDKRGRVWLYAYEYHYRENFYHAIRANYKRGRWAIRESRPQAQVMTCMDDREESLRRNLEEINPNIETVGAAGFFGIPMNYMGIDDIKRKKQCPLPVTPTNEVKEVPREGTERIVHEHNFGMRVYKRLAYVLNQMLRRSLILSHAVIDALAPILFFGLLGKIFMPKTVLAINTSMRQNLEKKVPTRLEFSAPPSDIPATPANPRVGFTDNEQADKIAVFLRTTGLSYSFAPIVCLFGHGSTNQNNPHGFAYNCGACSGKRGGPNARLFAAMINRPVIRKLLAERDIHVPDDTWFVGAEHDTCSDEYFWFDLEDIPEHALPAFEALRKDLEKASKASAHERCRRFVSANDPETPEEGKEHVYLRSNDFSQAFPEFNHATIAGAVIGRRSVSQGTFLDRRVFLISYDATQDLDGKLLENLLLAVGPVGSGINLEYYFSTVNNDYFGSGTKVTHNITGMFGVMEGANSDLRTGLTKQMVEIHEPVRLQVLIEAKNEIIGQIYERQAIIRELVGGGWILLGTIDPDTGEMYVFERGVGFVPWNPEKRPVPVFESSLEYYNGKHDPLPQVLIRQPDEAGV